MNVPILKLGNILLTSIQVELSDVDALRFQEAVVRKAVETEAEGFIVDITALAVVDSYLARVLNDTASMLHLVGTRAVICGMRPAVALTLVEMGRDLIGVETALDLDQGMRRLQALFQRNKKRGQTP